MNQEMILNYFVLSFLLFILIVAFGTALFFVFRNKKKWIKLNSKSAQDKIKTNPDDTPEQRQRENFASSLFTASASILAQEPKPEIHPSLNRSIPEKYKISAKMAMLGMKPDAIATVLDISQEEASQLVHLRNISTQRTGGWGEDEVYPNIYLHSDKGKELSATNRQ
jgi:hypothetical protein